MKHKAAKYETCNIECGEKQPRAISQFRVSYYPSMATRHSATLSRICAYSNGARLGDGARKIERKRRKKVVRGRFGVCLGPAAGDVFPSVPIVGSRFFGALVVPRVFGFVRRSHNWCLLLV